MHLNFYFAENSTEILPEIGVLFRNNEAGELIAEAVFSTVVRWEHALGQTREQILAACKSYVPMEEPEIMRIWRENFGYTEGLYFNGVMNAYFKENEQYIFDPT